MSTKNKRVQTPVHHTGELKNIPIGEIDYSPLNYRKFFSQDDIENFAKELSQHGIISPLTVRLMPSGRYELVAGERRLRGAVIAGIKEVPTVVKSLSDEEVIEFQLAENIQRENPHPMQEAQGIGQMLNIRKTIDEIAGRLGKSKQFVYTRLKLLALIEPMQEIFLADKINIHQAVEIAGLSTESQADLFEEECNNWKDNPEFELDNLSYLLRKYKYDLNDAPFNKKDKKLLPEAGACTNCVFNTATLASLFPEYAKEAMCNNSTCFHKKCAAHFSVELKKLLCEHKPSALLFYGQPTASMEELIDGIPETNELSRLLYYEVTVISSPEHPDISDYDEDKEGYQQALEEYQSELELYQQEIEAGNYQKGITISNRQIEAVWFSPEKASYSSHSRTSTVSAKDVEAAIKSGTVTIELLRGAVQKLHDREKRSKELDREKVQEQIHQNFVARLANREIQREMAVTDFVTAVLLIYQSLGWSDSCRINESLFNGERADAYEAIRNLTEQQYAYIIHHAIASKPESKLPQHAIGKCLYDLAKTIGVDIDSIEEKQREKAAQRRERYEEKVKELEKKIDALQPAIV